MKIVLDTNVFISGIFFGGPPSDILELWRQTKIRIVLTEQILEEYQRVGEEFSAKFPSISIEPIIRLSLSSESLLRQRTFQKQFAKIQMTTNSLSVLSQVKASWPYAEINTF